MSRLLLGRIAPGRVLGSGYRGESQHQIRLVLGTPGRCPGHANLTIAVFDDSGSVAGPAGSDPVSNRYVEAHAAFQALAKNCRCGQCQAAVVHFDLIGGAGPLPLKRQVPREVAQALRAPGGAGTSLLGPSLAEVNQIVQAATSVEEFTLVAFTDFELFDIDTPQLIRDMSEFPGEVHAVCLGLGVPPELAANVDERVHITMLDPHDSAPGAAARTLLRAMSTNRKGARVAPEPDESPA